MAKITLDYYGMTGTGATVKEAKLDAGRQIEQALNGDYTPSLIHWRQYTVLMAREPRQGWGYRISHPTPEHGETIQERMWLNGGHEDRDACLLQLVKHIADIARPTGENPEASLPFFNILPGHTMQHDAYRDFVDNCKRTDRFQLRHRHATDVLQLPNGDAHAWAGMDPSRYDLWKGTESMFDKPAWEAA